METSQVQSSKNTVINNKTNAPLHLNRLPHLGHSPLPHHPRGPYLLAVSPIVLLTSPHPHHSPVVLRHLAHAAHHILAQIVPSATKDLVHLAWLEPPPQTADLEVYTMSHHLPDTLVLPQTRILPRPVNVARLVTTQHPRRIELNRHLAPLARM